MPELPDVTIYIEHLQRLLPGSPLEQIRLVHAFFLRSADPPMTRLYGLAVRRVERLGKRIVLVFAEDYYVMLHLMIAGRLHWRPANCKIPPGYGLAALDFGHGTLLITEAGATRRAAMHILHGAPALNAFNAGGLEVLDASVDAFAVRLCAENHTLKRALTDPRLFSGIGNAYSDEILHRARLSPVQWTSRMNVGQIERLYVAAREILTEWTRRLREEAGDVFPEKVTAFRAEMAVHGRYNQPCPECGTLVQRIRYARVETNYCPRCQTNGRVLADRSLSLLLKKDWPRSIEELEEKRKTR